MPILLPRRFLDEVLGRNFVGSTSDYVQIGSDNSYDFDINETWSVCGLIKQSIPAGNVHSTPFSKWTSNPTGRQLRVFFRGSPNQMEVSGANNVSLGTISLINQGDQWAAWCITNNGAGGGIGDMRFLHYLCDEKVLREQTNTSAASGNGTLTNPVRLGGNPSGNHSTTGDIGPFAIIDGYELSAAEFREFGENPFQALRKWKARNTPIYAFVDPARLVNHVVGKATDGDITVAGTGSSIVKGFNPQRGGDTQFFPVLTTAGGAVTGTGALSSGASSVSGTGAVERKGTGALASGDSSMSGSGTREITGTGALQSGDSSMSGTGTVGAVVTGTGALQAGDSSIAGTGTREVTGTGALQAGDSSMAGTGEREITGTGSLQSGASSVAGTGEREITGTGALSSGASSMAGTGIVSAPGTFSTDFSEYSTGSSPSDWTEQWYTAGNAYSVESDTSSIGHQALQLTITTTGKAAISWNDVGTPNDDVEMLAQFEYAGATGSAQDSRLVRLYHWGSGSLGSENGYFIGVNGDETQLDLSYFSSGTLTNITNTAFSFSTGTKYWARFRLEKDTPSAGTNTLKVKIWGGGHADEPGAWAINTTDNNLTSGGWSGFGGLDAVGDPDLHWFSVAVGGGTAPSPVAISGTGALSSGASSMAGTGEREITGTGALSSGDSSIAGTGEREITGTGALASGDSSMAGSGTVTGGAIGTGDLQSQDSSMAGTGSVERKGTGALASGDSSMAGSGAVERKGTGSLVSGDSSMAGTGTAGSVAPITGAGALVSGDSSMSGAGAVARDATGALQAGDASMSGVGKVERKGTGALVAGPSTIVGRAWIGEPPTNQGSRYRQIGFKTLADHFNRGLEDPDVYVFGGGHRRFKDRSET